MGNYKKTTTNNKTKYCLKFPDFSSILCEIPRLFPLPFSRFSSRCEDHDHVIPVTYQHFVHVKSLLWNLLSEFVSGLLELIL